MHIGAHGHLYCSILKMPKAQGTRSPRGANLGRRASGYAAAGAKVAGIAVAAVEGGAISRRATWWPRCLAPKLGFFPWFSDGFP